MVRTATTSTGKVFSVDRNGFPVEQCRRCAGAGRIAVYGGVQGGTCFGCRGTGQVHPRGRISELATEFARTYQDACHVTLGARWNSDTRATVVDVRAGDRIEVGGTWRNVIAVRVTREVWGTGLIGSRLELTLRTDVTLDGGEVVHGTGTRVRRQPNVDVMVQLRQKLHTEARAEYEALLGRRAARRPWTTAVTR